MNQQPKSSKKTFIILIIIIVIALLIYFYTMGNPTENSSLVQTNTAGSQDAQNVGSRVLVLLNQINSLKIDSAIFTSATYKSLVDYSIVIPEQPVGRQNPFAPIPGSAPVKK
jgi:uncharacterized protein YpmS